MSNVIKTTGKFVKWFDRFVDGLSSLREVSFSASQALGDAKSEDEAVAVLATNAAFDRPTGNGVDWGRCSIQIACDGIDYSTTGGLGFGWAVSSQDYQWSREMERGGNSWKFYVMHPMGDDIPKESSLRAAANKAGWLEEFSDGNFRRPVNFPKLSVSVLVGTEVRLKPGYLCYHENVPFSPMYWVNEAEEVIAEAFVYGSWGYGDKDHDYVPCVFVYDVPVSLASRRGGWNIPEYPGKFAVLDGDQTVTGKGNLQLLDTGMHVRNSTKGVEAPEAVELLEALMAAYLRKPDKTEE